MDDPIHPKGIAQVILRLKKSVPPDASSKQQVEIEFDMSCTLHAFYLTELTSQHNVAKTPGHTVDPDAISSLIEGKNIKRILNPAAYKEDLQGDDSDDDEDEAPVGVDDDAKARRILGGSSKADKKKTTKDLTVESDSDAEDSDAEPVSDDETGVKKPFGAYQVSSSRILLSFVCKVAT
ncbi:hypothetical protein HDU84_001193, partial [Entophlyctis sp. JEL0112]